MPQTVLILFFRIFVLSMVALSLMTYATLLVLGQTRGDRLLLIVLIPSSIYLLYRMSYLSYTLCPAYPIHVAACITIGALLGWALTVHAAKSLGRLYMLIGCLIAALLSVWCLVNLICYPYLSYLIAIFGFLFTCYGFMVLAREVGEARRPGRLGSHH